MYTAFRSMIVVSLWLSARCAKRGSRLCGGGAFFCRSRATPAQMLFLDGNQVPGEPGKCPAPEGQQPPSWLTQFSHQPPPVWPTRRGRDEARLMLTITVGLLAARRKLPTMASEPPFHIVTSSGHHATFWCVSSTSFSPRVFADTHLGPQECPRHQTDKGSSLAGLTPSDEPPLITNQGT